MNKLTRKKCMVKKKVNLFVSFVFLIQKGRDFYASSKLFSRVMKQRKVLASRWPGTYCTEQHES